MKIVMFSRFPRDLRHPRGGVESATLGLLRGLLAIGETDIDVVTLQKDVTSASMEVHEGIRVHRLPASRWPMFLDIMVGPGRRRIESYIRSLNPDVVHFHETYGLLRGDYGVPSVFTVHGFDSLNLPTERRSFWRIRSFLWRLIENVGLGRQSHIISITPYVRKEIEARTRARIFDIDNAISEEFFRIPRAEVPGRIFFAGWINPRKNALRLVQAFAQIAQQVPEAHLHLAGEERDHQYASEIRRTINQHGLSRRVRLLGRVSQEEIRNQLAQASIFVLPSFQENAPMAIAEAMAAGVAVISSSVCGMPYMIENDRTGFLVAPDDTLALADRLLRLLRDGVLRQQMTAAARREAERRYHPLAVAKKTLSVYRTLLEEKARPAKITDTGNAAL